MLASEFLEKEFIRAKRLDVVILVSFVLLDILFLINIFSHHAFKKILIYSSLFLLLIINEIIQSIRFFFQKKDNLSDLKDDDKIGVLNVKNLKTAIEDLLKPFKGKEVPTVYFVDMHEANAFVLDSVLFNFIKPSNAVYISKVLCQYLSVEELKSVVAHEIAHFYKYMSPLFRNLFLLKVTVFLVSLIIFLGFDISLKLGIVCVFLLWIISHFLFQKIGQRKSKVNEYLCDLYAARRTGIIHTINAFLTMAKYTELKTVIEKSILRKIKKDKSLSLEHFETIWNIINSKTSDIIMSGKDASTQVDKIFKEKEIAELKREISDSQIKKEEQIINKILSSALKENKFKLINWDLFDFDKKDMRINEIEYPFLIKALKENPKHKIINLITEDEKFSRYSTHPSFRERILFLHDNLGLNKNN